MPSWVSRFSWLDAPPAVTTVTTAAADIITSSYMPSPMEVEEFGGVCSTAIVIGTTNAVLRFSTLTKAGTNTGRRDLAFATARSVGDYEFSNFMREGTTGAYFNIAVGERFRLRMNTAAAGGSAAGAVQTHVVIKPLALAESSTMTRTASTAV